MNVTAKIKLISKTPSTEGQTNLEFGADYQGDRNKAWAKYTPILSLKMTVLDVVAEQFEPGLPLTLTFSEE